MNNITKQMLLLFSGDPYEFEGVDEDIDIFLMHYGVGPDDNPPGRGSGRYEEGSGDTPYQHAGDFFTRVQRLKREHPELKGNDLAIAAGCRNTNDFRIQYSRALSEHRSARNSKIQAMLDSGKKRQEIADYFGVNESTLRSWLNPKSQERVNKAQAVADGLEKLVKERGLIDVGAGVEREIGVSKEKLKEALAILEDKGYPIYGGRVPQATNPGKQTTVKVLGDPQSDVKWSDIYKHPEKIQSVADYIVRDGPDGEDTFRPKWQYPVGIDPKRIMIRYADDVAPDGHTGLEKDGTIELRRNVPDLDLKGSHYAQVRIMTNNGKYLKGMAVYNDYNDNLPPGIDIVFNTNKTRDQANIVFKDIKTTDPNNPFGALLREEGGQYTYFDKDGVERLGAINKTRQEGDWEEWKDKLPSQFLAKQPMELINKQLSLTISKKKQEYEEILSLTNPTVKKEFLEDFANQCDSDSVHLSAAKLPDQKYQVILPVPTLHDDEVYAPNFPDGSTIALIRYPHGGLFEIPILRVNNKNPQGQALLGTNPIDGIGLNKVNADRLSGADFDGDTVMCIPCNDPKYSDTQILNIPPLRDLEGFDPKMQYGYDSEPVVTYEKSVDDDGNIVENKVVHYYRNGKEFKPMTRTGYEMGVVSNLIMDMTLKGAPLSDLALAVKHSMVVIDAEKHHLDWKASEIDNRIDYLKRKYQQRIDEDGEIHYGGASTLLTRAKSPVQIVKPTGTPHIDPETGKMVYKESQLVPQTFIGKDGKERIRMEDEYLLNTKDSAWELVSTYNGSNQNAVWTTSPKEAAYAIYSDQLRAMANEARKEILRTGDIKLNRSAREQYSEEVARLEDEILKSEKNAPRERMAQYYAKSVTLARKEENPDITKKELKKISNQALANGRIKYGAKRNTIDISEREWEAIQAGCISSTSLKKLLKYADMDKVRQYAMPHQGVQLTAGQEQRIQNMIAAGKTAAQIADTMHVSVSTVNKYKKEM